MQDIVLLLALFFTTLLPVIFWGYTFSYIDSSLANKKRFIVGTLAGIVSVIPVLYLDGILQAFSLEKLSAFYWISSISTFNGMSFFGALLLLLVSIFCVSLIVALLGLSVKKINILLKNFSIFIVFMVGMSFFVSLINKIFIDFPQINLNLPDTVLGSYVLHSLELVILYYLLVAILEEASKHFHFLSASILQINSIKQGVLYAIFIALGFSFVENILYLYAQFQNIGMSFEFVKLFFYRSSFALIVHVFCSSFLAYWFSKAYLQRTSMFSIYFLKTLAIGFGGAVVLHAIFDIGLTLGFSLVMFIYFVVGYLYVSSIFYQEEEQIG